MCPTYTMSSLISRNVATKTQVMSRMSTMPTQMHDNRENNATCDIQVWNKPKINVAINDNDDNVVPACGLDWFGGLFRCRSP